MRILCVSWYNKYTSSLHTIPLHRYFRIISKKLLEFMKIKSFFHFIVYIRYTDRNLYSLRKIIDIQYNFMLLFCCCCCCCFFLHLCYYKSFLPYNPTEKDWFTEIILFRLQYSHFFFSTLCTLVCFMWLSIYQFQNDFALFQLNPCNICIYQTTCIETNSNITYCITTLELVEKKSRKCITCASNGAETFDLS